MSSRCPRHTIFGSVLVIPGGTGPPAVGVHMSATPPPPAGPQPPSASAATKQATFVTSRMVLPPGRSRLDGRARIGDALQSVLADAQTAARRALCRLPHRA